MSDDSTRGGSSRDPGSAPHLGRSEHAAPYRLEGERRSVTVLFADMVGFTPLTERIGEDAIYGLMHGLLQELISIVHRQSGTVHELTGDGLMALFGAPTALEDAPLCAARAAVTMQARMAAREAEVEARYGVRPKFRIGLNSGPVVIGRVGDDRLMEFTALGDTVNLAARLQSVAEPGGILLSEATFRLLEGHVEASNAGVRHIKGKAEPVPVYALTAIRPDVTRLDATAMHGLTPFSGRNRELDTLRDLWRQAGGGAIRFADIVGEAGIGKSRLMREFSSEIDSEQGFPLRGHCTAEGRTTPYFPFIEVSRRSFRISEHDDAANAERKLRSGLAALQLDAGRHLPYLANLLGLDTNGALGGLDDEIVGVRTRETLQVLLIERCRLSPVLIALDDLHWLDSASEGLLLWMAQSNRPLPLMVLCGYRPEYRPPWNTSVRSTEIALRPLATDEVLAVCKHRLGVASLPRALARFLRDKTEGNPLFAEELTRYLRETGRVRRLNGDVELADEDGHTGLPGSLESILMQRVERLDEPARRALQTAAVIGRPFNAELLGEASGLQESAAQAIAVLERHEFLFAQVAGRVPQYRIKHALVQDAVYQGLLSDERTAMHLAVARAIERLFPDRLSEMADALAHHYGRTREAGKTMRYLAEAGERSLRVYALDEALAQFQRAFDLVRAHPDAATDSFRIDLVLQLARLHYFHGDFRAIVRTIEPYVATAEALGDRRRLARCLIELGYAHVFAARSSAGRPLLERGLALAREAGDATAVGHAAMGLAFDHMVYDPPSPEQRALALRLAEESVGHGERAADVWVASKGLYALWVYYMVHGDFGRAAQVAQRLLDLGRKLNDHRPTALGLTARAAIDALNGRIEEGFQMAAEATRLCHDPLTKCMVAGDRGGLLLAAGRAREACESLRSSLDHYSAGEARIPGMKHDIDYGLALVLAGEFANGVRWIDEAISRRASWGDRWSAAFGHLVLGEIYLNIAFGKEKPSMAVMARNWRFLLGAAPMAKRRARRHFERALDGFRAYDAPALIAWTLVGLGRLAAGARRRDQARARFAEAERLAASADAVALRDKAAAALTDLEPTRKTARHTPR